MPVTPGRASGWNDAAVSAFSSEGIAFRVPLLHDYRLGIFTAANEMHLMMDGMGWMSGGMGLIGLLVLVVLVLGIAALFKYLMSRR